jgi:hypothetical protein
MLGKSVNGKSQSIFDLEYLKCQPKLAIRLMANHVQA